MMKFWTNSKKFGIPVMVCMAWLLTVGGWPCIALAQDAAPQPSLTRTPSPLVGFGIMAVFAVVIVAISLLPSKRGHQD